MAPGFISGFHQGSGLMLATFLLLFSLSFSIVINGLEGQKSFQDLDLEQLRILNKPFLKSIKTDECCVNIDKQPAFDHPLLKNHQIQMEPSSPKGLKSAKSLPAKSLNIEILKNGGCPSGTVPIKRTSKEDLIRAKLFLKSTQPTAAASPCYHVINSFVVIFKFFLIAKINKQNPSVSNTQFSEAFVRVRSGSQNQIDNIQVGWMAGKKGCYNMLCTGSVQVNKAIPLGFILHNISVYGGQKFDFGYFISQNIGYWPKSLFSSLSNAATQLTWGGGVFSSNNAGNPPMGSGHFAEEGMKKQLISERFLLKNLVMEDLLTQGVSKTSQMIPSVTALVLFQESIMAFFMGVQEMSISSLCWAHLWGEEIESNILAFRVFSGLHQDPDETSSSLEGLMSANSPSKSLEIPMLKNGGCPSGTVPIRRANKEELIRTKLFKKRHMKDIHPTASNSPGFHVNPSLNGDYLTRLCAQWTLANKQGCHDTLCPGFVQVSKDIPLGSFFLPSVYGGKQNDFACNIFKDPKSGNWWLSFGDDDQIGYWPSSLFSSLSSSATEIAWGGAVFTTNNEASPPMVVVSVPNKA
ncbi:PREDICTED: uncharacterized protein LOC18606541 [Theobroma cacao]|uniref:Uncharacterized protein LOC18606541 n=1 Tax=Theobroma cacao TaxID=3641 RepID=A0AB32W3C0_THECC|nr:PREDICTED: uncharacterized protein LOC18606541 [Theobroma cacao]